MGALAGTDGGAVVIFADGEESGLGNVCTLLPANRGGDGGDGGGGGGGGGWYWVW